jgi:hypothetical protein
MRKRNNKPACRSYTSANARGSASDAAMISASLSSVTASLFPANALRFAA